MHASIALKKRIIVLIVCAFMHVSHSMRSSVTMSTCEFETANFKISSHIMKDYYQACKLTQRD
jgi:hypothetical protein